MKTTCPYCREEIAPGELFVCSLCHTPHHHACWEENQGCTVWGCKNAPGDDSSIPVDTNSQNNITVELPSKISQSRLYYINRDEKRMGPYTIEEVHKYFEDRLLLRTDLAWCEGMSSQIPVSELFSNRPLEEMPTTNAPEVKTISRPKSYLPDTLIFTTICFIVSVAYTPLFVFCLFPCIIALTNSFQVDYKYDNNNYNGANIASDKANMWKSWAFVIFILLMLVVLLYDCMHAATK